MRRDRSTGQLRRTSCPAAAAVLAVRKAVCLDPALKPPASFFECVARRSKPASSQSDDAEQAALPSSARRRYHGLMDFLATPRCAVCRRRLALQCSKVTFRKRAGEHGLSATLNSPLHRRSQRFMIGKEFPPGVNPSIAVSARDPQRGHAALVSAWPKDIASRWPRNPSALHADRRQDARADHRCCPASCSPLEGPWTWVVFFTATPPVPAPAL